MPRSTSTLPGRRGWLLLAAVVLVAVALDRPRYELPASQPGATVLCVDGSASVGGRLEDVAGRLADELDPVHVVRSAAGAPRESDLARLLERGASELGGAPGRIVLVTDGIHRGGDLAPVLDALVRTRVRVDAVVADPPQPALRIASVRMPEALRPSERFEVSVRLAGADARATLRLEGEGESVQREVSVAARDGDAGAVVNLPWRAPATAGTLRLELRLATADAPVATPLVSLVALVGGVRPVGLIGRAALPPDWPDDRPARPVEPSAAGLAAVEAVIVAGRVPPRAQREIDRAVRERGLGLLLQGGEESFGAGGWIGTPLGDLSPLDPSPRDRTPVSLVVLADRSGSMDAARIDRTRAALATVVERLAPGDELLLLPYAAGLLTETTEPWLRVDAGEEDVRVRALASYPPGVGRGATRLSPALEPAVARLASARSARGDLRRLLLVLTDAELSSADLEGTPEDVGVYARLASLPEGIDVLVAVTADEPGVLASDRLVAAGVGPRVRAYAIGRPDGDFADELGALLADELSEEWFADDVVPLLERTAEGDERPRGQLGRRNRVAARADAPPELVTGKGEPVAAFWRRGRGRVLAVAASPGSADGPAGSGGALSGSGFWTSCVDRVTDSNRTLAVTVRTGGERVQVTAKVADWQTLDPPRLVLDGGETRTMHLQAPGQWFAEVDRAAVSETVTVRTRGEQVTRLVAAGPDGAEPVRAELERLSPDVGLLESIARATGGALRSAASVQEGMRLPPPPRASRSFPLAPWLLLAAAALVALSARR